MHFRFPDGSLATVMQQMNGMYILIFRGKETAQVGQVVPDRDKQFVATFTKQAFEMGARLAWECVA
jgi:hypothetical protein